MLVDMEVVETERLNSLGETIRQEFRNGENPLQQSQGRGPDRQCEPAQGR